MIRRKLQSLCALFLVGFAGVLYAQQTTQPPNTNAGFLQSSAASLIQLLKLHKPDANNPTEREIEAIVRGLPLGDVHIPGVWICSGCGGASSHPDLGIIIDTAQLDFIRTQSHIENPHVMLVFVVAHEAAHQVQYAKYGRNVLSLPLEDRRYYEAQADILAGIWLCQDAGVLPLTEASANLTISQAFHAVYDLGVEQYALASHPSREARAFAIRTGFQIGWTRRPFLGDVFKNEANTATILRQLGVKTGESDLDFSLRVARRLTTFNSVAAQDLVRVVSKDDLAWDKSSDNPLVTYHLTYANRGSKALHLSLEALCLEVSRKDLDDFFQTVQVSSKYHEFDIQAGGQTTITGQLRWIATGDRSPFFRVPPDEFGLVEVHYADGSDSSTGTSDPTPMRFSPEEALAPLPTDPHGYGVTFSRFLQLSLHGYTTIRKGPGSYFPAIGVTEYGSSVAIPGSINSMVEIGPIPGITSTLLRTTNAKSASSLFDTTVDLVRSALKNTPVPNATGEWHDYSSGDEGAEDRYTSFHSSPYTVRVRLQRKEEGGGQGTPPIVYFYVKVEWTGVARSNIAMTNGSNPVVAPTDRGTSVQR